MQLITLEKCFVKQFTIEPEKRFEERRILSEISAELSRLNINEMINKHGMDRVFRVLAATVLRSPERYEEEAIFVARQVPKLNPSRDWESWFVCSIHPIYAQQLILEYARLREK